MPELLSVSEAARRLGAKPKDISDLFYRRELRDDLCPIIAGRRVILEGYLDAIRSALKRKGRRVSERNAAERDTHKHPTPHPAAGATEGHRHAR